MLRGKTAELPGDQVQAVSGLCEHGCQAPAAMSGLPASRATICSRKGLYFCYANQANNAKASRVPLDPAKELKDGDQNGRRWGNYVVRGTDCEPFSFSS